MHSNTIDCDGAEAVAAEGQLLNPPYIHHVAVTPCANRPAVRLAAAARGDGAIALYDMDVQVGKLSVPLHVPMSIARVVAIPTESGVMHQARTQHAADYLQGSASSL